MADAITFEIFRTAEDGRTRFDRFPVPREGPVTVLDGLAWIQRTLDPTLAFRYACRVGMCGTCALVIDGREGWACRTRLRDLDRPVIRIEPLRHFPIVRDLAVDMAPFFERYMAAGGAFVPRSEASMPAAPVPAAERKEIDPFVECISCGMCYSACRMVALSPPFLGPAALNRAFTLARDGRDALGPARVTALLGEEALWRCHFHFACVEVCPKHIDPAQAIQRLRQEAVGRALGMAPTSPPAALPARRGFLIGAGAAVALLAAGAWMFFRQTSASPGWSEAIDLPPIRPGAPVAVQYAVLADGERISRRAFLVTDERGQVVALSGRCTHQGCPVFWKAATQTFLCPCHGGIYDRSGKVLSGPPPRPLVRLETRIDGGRLRLRGEEG